ncbi:AzlD domain-containing protein [Limosilactobacillus panis]|uniref:AzlD domain-containing protein n=1 Tax=Limosilactobacillus panis TaxID=47493 RepID=A0ABT7VKL0_9LACO|nr:AzlD domain-containing protein [Limosilactobacillus panis]MDM8333271.1 AzlD domain-containing protein [Limosilactobacillus panis]HJA21456.1 AzlD domain-containing protein [Candidatus Limosilactobacillus intestinipullorum]
MEQLFTNMPVLIAHAGQNKILYHLIVIVIAAVAAFIPRYFPVLFFSTRKIPEWFNEWMKYVPVSLFTALVVKNVFITTAGYRFVPFGHVEQILAAVVVMIVAYFTRSMAMSVIGGLVAVWLLSMVI